MTWVSGAYSSGARRACHRRSVGSPSAAPLQTHVSSRSNASKWTADFSPCVRPPLKRAGPTMTGAHPTIRQAPWGTQRPPIEQSPEPASLAIEDRGFSIRPARPSASARRRRRAEPGIEMAARKPPGNSHGRMNRGQAGDRAGWALSAAVDGLRVVDPDPVRVTAGPIDGGRQVAPEIECPNRAGDCPVCGRLGDDRRHHQRARLGP